MLNNELKIQNDKYITIEEVCDLLKCHRNTADKLCCKCNDVKIVKGKDGISNRKLYSIEEINKIKHSQEQQQQLMKTERKADKINKNFTDEEVLIAFGNNLQEKNPEDILKLSIQMMGLSLTKMKNANEIEVNALKNENENLKIELGKSKEYYSIKKVSIINNKKQKEYDWRLLKRKSLELNREIKVEQDNNYDKVNSYHIDVWKEVYPEEKY